MKAKVIGLRNKTTRELEAYGYPVIPSQTNFFMVSLEGRTVQPVIEEFRAKGILVGRPFPPMVQHLRVSVGVPEEMDRFLKAFREIFPPQDRVHDSSRMNLEGPAVAAGPASVLKTTRLLVRLMRVPASASVANWQ